MITIDDFDNNQIIVGVDLLESSTVNILMSNFMVLNNCSDHNYCLSVTWFK